MDPRLLLLGILDGLDLLILWIVGAHDEGYVGLIQEEAFVELWLVLERSATLTWFHLLSIFIDILNLGLVAKILTWITRVVFVKAFSRHIQWRARRNSFFFRFRPPLKSLLFLILYDEAIIQFLICHHLNYRLFTPSWRKFKGLLIDSERKTCNRCDLRTLLRFWLHLFDLNWRKGFSWWFGSPLV